MPEWTNGAVSKTVDVARHPWVRIPSLPQPPLVTIGRAHRTPAIGAGSGGRVVPSLARLRGGGLAERSKAHAWKACRGATPSRVRTPQPPPRNRVIHLRVPPRRLSAGPCWVRARFARAASRTISRRSASAHPHHLPLARPSPGQDRGPSRAAHSTEPPATDHQPRQAGTLLRGAQRRGRPDHRRRPRLPRLDPGTDRRAGLKRARRAALVVGASFSHHCDDLPVVVAARA